MNKVPSFGVGLLFENCNKRNTNGAFFVSGYQFFYKILRKKDFEKEKAGYHHIKKHYTVPRLLYSKCDYEKGILLYEYNLNLNDNCGLLVDYFAKTNTLDDTFFQILDNYYAVFKKTLALRMTKSVDVFFKDRIPLKLECYLEQKFISKYNHIKMFINGQLVEYSLRNIIEEIKAFFSIRDRTYTVVSQCDPNDLNICEDGMILDYLGGGFTPLMAEFATYLWFNLAQSEYLSLLYNPESYLLHGDIQQHIRQIRIHDELAFEFRVRDIRKEAIFQYIELIIKPLLENLDFASWYVEFKNYIAMKILSVFDLRTMKEEDVLLSLAYLGLFYRSNFTKIEDLKNFINLII